MPDRTLLDLARMAALDALAVLLPVTCAGCGGPDRALCAECCTALDGPLIRRRLKAASGEHPSSLPELDTVSAVAYEGTVRSALLAFKEQGRTDVAGALAVSFARAVEAALDDHRGRVPNASGIVLCPVPQGAASARARGYDPVRMLARRITGRRVPPLLRRVAPSGTQKLLGIEDRLRNARGTLRARHALHGMEVLLIDDVVTSGATLLEAARAVWEAGGEVIGAAALAATPLRHAESRPPS
ncbi:MULTISPECIES: ComF family protein [unclassified Salinibacterium]|uniref:ComF family protein n=1 Tax=unclassified Salinibacterium TaxID=2632331 RepID=UPI00143D5250|nr:MULTISPECIES: phosphoribosyltransferase family protein [unclassified Salinibacterium]